MTTSTPRRFSFFRGSLLLAMILAGGCGNSSPPQSRVSGAVSVNGEALDIGTVLFMANEGYAASAELTADGTYALYCPPGRYHVAVCPPPLPDPMVSTNSDLATLEKANGKIPRIYQDVGTSGLVTEVKLGENSFDIQMDFKRR